MYTVAGTTGSQFFIYTADNPTQDFDSTTNPNKVYPIGKVTAGLDVLDRIASIPTNDTNFATSPVIITAVVIQQMPKTN
jgi:cyclophilin family peptidyl-prolyl cis-trans isomerase